MSDNRNDVDIDRQKLGKIYAVALLGAAEKAGRGEEVVEELGDIIDSVFDRSSELESSLSTPRVGTGQKLDLLNKLFAGKITNELLDFLKVVAQHGRFRKMLSSEK